jgi:molecular chaperone DnaK
VTDAESHAAEDKERRKQVETRNTLDNLVYQTQKVYDENKEKLTADVKGQVESALVDAKKALDGEDVAAMEQAVTQLQQASHKMAEIMYQGGQGGQSGAESAGGGHPGGEAAGGGQPGGEPGASDDEVIDAEYVDVDK